MMKRYYFVRIGASLMTLLGLSILVFLCLHILPGSVIDNIVGVEGLTDPELERRMRAEFGLDRPLPLQYLNWLGDVLVGDLGTSWRFDRPVAAMIFERLPLTAELALVSMLMALGTGIPLGVVSALHRDSLVDHVVRVLSMIGRALPVFWLGTLILLILSSYFRWMPPTGYVSPMAAPLDNLKMILIPAAVLGTASGTTIMRMTRGAMLDVLEQDYMRTARAKGLPEVVVAGRHALKNALIPVITVAAVQTGHLMGGTVLTENVFALAGLGRMLTDAIAQRDYPVVQGVVLLISALFIVVNLLADLLYSVVDPRIRLE